jgi:Rap1a immunity proteins
MVCLGDAIAVLELARGLQEPLRFCPPPNVTYAQAVNVAVVFMMEHPKFLDRDITRINVLALHDAWPCEEADRTTR